MKKIRASIRNLAGAAFLALIALPALAQPAPQNLTIAFEVSIPAAPLSDWLTAGIALLLAATAVIAMRRQKARGARFFSALVVLAAGATILSVAGDRLARDAIAALPPPVINLVTSPASLDVAPYNSETLSVTVNNLTGKFAKITSITLANGPYFMFSPTTCTVGLTLGPGNTCIVTLILD